MGITGGFGMTMDLERGTMRQWTMGRDGVKRWADTNKPVETRPRCAVGGMVRPGAMCGSVIVGGKLCGHTVDCQHKVSNVELRGRAAGEGPVERSGTNLSAGLGGADIGDSK